MAAAITGGMARAEDPIPPLNVSVVSNWDGHAPDYTAADHWADDRGYAYVCNRLGATIDIMDISDAANPALVTIYEIPAPNQFCNAKEVKVHDGLMIIGLDDDGNDHAQIVDVRDPANPQLLVNIRLPEFRDVHNLFFDSGYLYLVSGREPKLAVIDLTQFDPDNPPPNTISTPLWELHDIGNSIAHDVTVVDGLAYLSAWDSGIRVYDVTNIANEPPVFLASAVGDSTHAAWPTPDKRWIVTNEERTDGGPVKLYEVTGTDSGGISISLRDTFAIPQNESQASHNVYVVGYRAYCAWYNRGLMAFDIDPVNKELVLVAHFDTSEVPAATPFRGAWGVYPFLGRDKVLVSDKETQLWVFDVRIPGSGDFNGDADVDFGDFGGLQLCFTGSDVPYTDEQCEIFDFDSDLDVDGDDYEAYLNALTPIR